MVRNALGYYRSRLPATNLEEDNLLPPFCDILGGIASVDDDLGARDEIGVVDGGVMGHDDHAIGPLEEAIGEFLGSEA